MRAEGRAGIDSLLRERRAPVNERLSGGVVVRGQGAAAMRSASALRNRDEARLAARSLRLAIFAALVAMLVLVGASVAYADDDLPGRVGRIADFGGQLYVSALDRADEWTSVGINYPVASGDNLWVSSDGRAEVDYGGGQFRLAGDTSVNVSRLDDHQLTLFVARGRLIVRVRVLDTGDIARIDTPNTQIELARPGLYRIEVAPDISTTRLGVREGEGLVALRTGAQQVLAGQIAIVSGTEPLAADMRNGFGADGLDSWSADRDRYYERARAAPYVSRQMVGFVDLDQYGSWEDTPAYGAVWYPTVVAPDWAPYEDGYWTNVDGWGLTWVDSAPWGYAPSHYGRWVRDRGRWGWCPGGYIARPRWAPALVAWYGGAGWGIRASGGAPVYAWVPLGWGDAYTPWWRTCSQGCWNRYNKPFGVDPGARADPRPRYSNIDVPGAMTAVPGATLVGRTPVSTTRVPVPAFQRASAPALATPPSVTPRSYAGQVFRPGERGTPTPASAVSSTAQRTVFLPRGPRTAYAEPAAPGAAGARGTPGTPLSQTPTQVRAAPLPAGPAQAGEAMQASRHPAPALPPASGPALRDPTLHSGAAVAPGTVVAPMPSSTPYSSRGSYAASVPLPATGIALPPPGVTVPPTGNVLPPPGMSLPPTGIVLPPASAMFPSTRPAVPAVPGQQPVVVVVPAGAPAVVPQGDHGAARGAGAADGARTTQAGAAPATAPASPR